MFDGPRWRHHRQNLCFARMTPFAPITMIQPDETSTLEVPTDGAPVSTKSFFFAASFVGAVEAQKWNVGDTAFPLTDPDTLLIPLTFWSLPKEKANVEVNGVCPFAFPEQQGIATLVFAVAAPPSAPSPPLPPVVKWKPTPGVEEATVNSCPAEVACAGHHLYHW